MSVDPDGIFDSQVKPIQNHRRRVLNLEVPR